MWVLKELDMTECIHTLSFGSVKQRSKSKSLIKLILPHMKVQNKLANADRATLFHIVLRMPGYLYNSIMFILHSQGQFSFQRTVLSTNHTHIPNSKEEEGMMKKECSVHFSSILRKASKGHTKHLPLHLFGKNLVTWPVILDNFYCICFPGKLDKI